MVLEDRAHGIVYWCVDKATDYGEYGFENSKHEQGCGRQTLKCYRAMCNIFSGQNNIVHV